MASSWGAPPMRMGAMRTSRQRSPSAVRMRYALVKPDEFPEASASNAAASAASSKSTITRRQMSR